MNNIPKRQHYVPKFYLKEFATDNTYGKKDKAQVHIYDLENEKKDIRNIKTIAYEKYLYSPQNEENPRSSYMEDKLADMESLMSKIWKGFANTRMGLSSSMKKGVSLFIATLILRHPENLDKNKEMKTFLDNVILNNIPEGETKFSFIANGKENIINLQEVKDSYNSTEYEESVFFIENIELLSIKIAEELIKKKWSIIASEEKVFITSDRPVIISNPTGGLLGIGSKGVVISLPLSPSRLLILEDNINNEEDLTEYPLNKGHASFFNRHIFSNGFRYIIGHKDIEEVVNEIFTYEREVKN
jgi:hypothetical protein